MGHEAACTVSHVSVAYAHRQALRDVSLQVQQGVVTGLVGANGSGKSTLMRVIAGVQRAGQGSVALWGEDLARDEAAGHGVGITADGLGLWPSWTARQHLAYVRDLSGSGDPVDDLLDQVGLTDNSGMRVRHLSLGNRQRVSLAMALMTGSRLLILDEPMEGLDPPMRRNVRDLLHKLARQGRTILLSSHDLREVETSCADLLVLDQGRLVYAGPTQHYTGDTVKVIDLVIEPTDRALTEDILRSAGTSYSLHAGNVVLRPADLSHTLSRLRSAGVRVLDEQERDATLEERF